MPLHYLDPRKAGTGAAPDVMVWEVAPNVWEVSFLPATYHDSEQSALRAAREAAGYGDVAEQPCAKYTAWRPCTDAGCEKHRADRTRFGECIECCWSRDAHGKGR